MAIGTTEKNIDGKTYHVTHFGGVEGVKIKASMVKYFGPSIGSLLFGAAKSDKKFSETEIDVNTLSSAFQDLFLKIDENEYVNFLLRLLRNTKVKETSAQYLDITEDVFNTIFADNYMSLYKVILFVLEFNYKNSFFAKGAFGSLTSVMEKVKNMIPKTENVPGFTKT